MTVTFRSDPSYRSAVIEEAKKRYELQKYKKYQKDPVGFCEEILGITNLTDAQKEILESVRDNQVTVVESANGIGKTFSAADVVVWFYKVFEQSQVYTTAAPPLENLKKLLWGEIGKLKRSRPNLFENDRDRELLISRPIDSLDPSEFITGVTIPTVGGSEEREAKFCADADDVFEMRDGSIVRYGDLIGCDVPVVSADADFQRKQSCAKFFDNGVQSVYKVELEDGDVVYRTGNHPLYGGWDIGNDYHVYDDKSHVKGRVRVRQEGWVNVSDLGKGYAVLCPDTTDFNFGSKWCPESLLKFLAYMIGDGCFKEGKKSNRLQFTQNSNAQFEEFIQILDEVGVQYRISDKEKYSWSIAQMNDVKLAKLTKMWGIYGKGSADKFIPSFVFNLQKEQVALFLSRLFSTDGWASLSNKAEIGYTSKSEQLIRGIQILLSRFGIRGKIISKVTKWEHEGEKRSGVYWTIFIWNAYDVIRFCEQIGIYGKEDAVNKCYEYSKNVNWNHANWKFEKEGYRWKKVKSVRYIGERPTVGVSVPGDNTYLTSLVEHNSGKHAPNLLFVVDEGDAVPEEVYRGIESCMSGGMARLLVMYNPRSDGGPVSKLKAEGANVIIADAFQHPNVTTGKDIIPGAVTREKTINRIHAWTRPYEEAEALGFVGFGSYDVPEHLVGVSCLHEKTREPLPPLQPGRRMVIDSRFSYMVLARYPGTSIGIIYDTWRDGWENAVIDSDLKQIAENRPWHECARIDWPDIPGNVSPQYDYEPGAGPIYFSIDDGYEGKLDENGNFTADSHPRTIGIYQHKPNGDMVLFDEIYMILEPLFEPQITMALDKGYDRPEFVVLGPGSKALGGWLVNNGFYKKTWAGKVEDSIKEVRRWISPDENGRRRFLVHPRCKHTRYEYARYRKDEKGRIKKEHDHGPDRDRYLLWMFRNSE